MTYRLFSQLRHQHVQSVFGNVATVLDTGRPIRAMRLIRTTGSSPQAKSTIALRIRRWARLAPSQTKALASRQVEDMIIRPRILFFLDAIAPYHMASSEALAHHFGYRYD